MDEDNDSDRRLSGNPDFRSSHERTGSMTLGAAPNPNGDDVSPINGDSAAPSTIAPPSAQPPTQVDPNARVVRDVLDSEVNTSDSSRNTLVLTTNLDRHTNPS